MKIAIFDAKEYEKPFFNKANSNNRHEIQYFKENLTLENAHMTKGFDAVSGFVNTYGDFKILQEIKNHGVKFWFQRSMGYNKIDLKGINKLNMHAWRVKNYSSETVAEHAITLMLSVNRRITKSCDRVQHGNFSLEGLLSKCIKDSVVGVIGMGQIGESFVRGVSGMGPEILVFDEFMENKSPQKASEIGFEFVTLDNLLKRSDFISIHVPLTSSTMHMINKESISKMKDGVVIINVSRGEIIDTPALIDGIESGKVKSAGLDVLEREEGRFFFDRTNEVWEIKKNDPEWKYLLESKDVLITFHQAFFTELALKQIAEATLKHADDAENGDFSQSLQLQADGKILNG